MFLRIKDGLYAGEVREYAPDVARELLRQGRAVNPFNEIEDTPEVRAADAAARQDSARDVDAARPQVRRKARP